MKRFISHEELARDSRFKRAAARGRLLESLPDDVDGVVALIEHVAPRLRERVEGTELEKVYDELGPGYPFLTQFGSLHPEDPNVEVQLKVRLHGIFVGELQALEGAGRTLWDFPDAPWEFRMNMARQCWDESRHCQVFEKLLDHIGVEVGDYPETTTLFEAACADDPTLRADSGPTRSPNPAQADHRFRFNPITNSGRTRSPVPVPSRSLFRGGRNRSGRLV